MTRSNKASAAAILAGLVTVAGFASAAQACISCQYVPEVVREHQTHSARTSYGRAQIDMAAIAQRKAQAARAAQAQAAQARMAQARMAAQQHAARQAAAERRIETASITPEKTHTDRKETVTVAKTTASGAASGSYALLKSDADKKQSAATEASTKVAAATPVESVPVTQPEPAPVTAKPAVVEKTAEAVGCKRFIPAVGVTLSIACN